MTCEVMAPHSGSSWLPGGVSPDSGERQSGIEPATTAILAKHAASYWQRGLSRREIGDSTVVWAIDGEPVLEFRFAPRGPSSLVVHDFSLYDPLRKAIRTRHVRLRFAAARDLGRPDLAT